jgi:ferredoxin
MPTLTIEGKGPIDVPAGTKLVLAVEDSGVDILHRCGGNAKCTTCRVEILHGDPGPIADIERERLAREAELAPNVRLSCQVRVTSDLTIRVLRTTTSTGLPAGPRPED